jgi:predicted phage baseplate assembly protein
VIADSLELRVREPLGDEEIQELNSEAPGKVIDPLPNGLPGKWVLWKKVDNLVDGTKDARIYTLDATEGTITFGDGRHGRIPPIGVDSIVAVSYKRGGGDAANDIVAWSQITLVSAIQGVQAVIAPEGAAGGSDPQTADEVVRFAPATLAMRDRALTLQDLVVLAVQSSRDVAQARAFPAPGGARLTVVMRGRNPQPPQPVIRAIRRYLAERTTPMLAAQGAIDVRGPVVVDVRIALALTIDAVENSGAVAAEAQQRVAALLDPADGGIDKAGWRLGDVPAEADIAAVLADIPHLEEVREINVTIAATGALATAIAGDAIARLADNGVTTAFAVLEGSLA